MSILALEQLCKAFGRLQVTNNVKLVIEAGERHVIIGPNGAGKSSLINQIGGQLTPDAGRILIKGRDSAGRPPEQIARMGVARTFQKNNLFASLSALENVRLAVQAKHGTSLDPFTPTSARRDLTTRALAALDMVHLRGRASELVNNLSYGEQRELEIAAALAAEPEILLLDEPTAGMSVPETQRMVDIIATLPRTITVIMIEHDMHVVFSLADRITVLHYGEVLLTGIPVEIAGNERVKEVYLGGVL
jgi:branched-chain amino acid transport system ATP-binding protein